MIVTAGTAIPLWYVFSFLILILVTSYANADMGFCGITKQENSVPSDFKAAVWDIYDGRSAK